MVLVLAVLAAGTVAVYRALHHLVLVERCTAVASTHRVSLSPDQADNAAVIVGVAVRRKLPTRAAVIALATAMQESKLRNLAHGDRDSLGLFQQRPSQGWGTATQVRDPAYAAGRFYTALVAVPDYTAMPLAEAAQRVQRSGAPTAYARHEADAQVLGNALTGTRAATLTCAIRSGEYQRQSMGADGLIPRADTVRQELRRDFGKLSLGGFAPGGVHSGHIEGSAHYEGRAIDVLFRPTTTANRRHGWAVAQWAVARADELGITEVIYDGRIWTSRRSTEGWRTYQPPGGPTTNKTLMHRDHVHLTIARGD